MSIIAFRRRPAADEFANRPPAFDRRLRRLRQLSRIDYVEAQHRQALERLAEERARIEAELAELERQS